LPLKAKRPCLYPGCVNTVNSGYCTAHAHFYNPLQRTVETRPSAAVRGYGREWQSIRAEILTAASIPRNLWNNYDIHHEPPYNPSVEKNHRKYKLTPLLKSEHSKITARGGRGCKSLGVLPVDRSGSFNFHSSKMGEGLKNG